jgi:CHAT domain
VARSVKLNNANEWTVVTTVAGTARRAAGQRAAIAPEVIPPAFLAPGVSVDRVMEVTPTMVRRAAGVPMVDLSVVPDSDETYALAIRHPSGALTFHGPDIEIGQRRGRRAAPATFRFRVTLRGGQAAGDRRGVVSAAVKVILLKVGTKIVDALLPMLAAKAESALWKKAGLSEGWFKIDEASVRSGKLQAGAPSGPRAGGRALLFLHGTFSDAVSAFKDLADKQFFAQVKPLYGDEIYAFNHFTVSKTPEENARELLAGLPNREIAFDVITHSRGGLVLRNLVERKSVLGAAASRFKLRHAVLVASPNDGTPLATPKRWEATVGWFANLLELFPENPLTFGAGFVANGIVWIAQRAAGGLPGIASMDGAGEMIAELQGPPQPPASSYSALVSNFTPSGNILERMADVGVDAFFGSANDLVVPSAGGWLIDRTDGPPSIPPDRIGCFGPGGNFPSSLPPVNHLNFFGRPETALFLTQALIGTPHGLPQVNPSSPLPDSRSRRGAAGVAAIAPPVAPAVPPVSPVIGPRLAPTTPGHSVFSDALQLMLIAPRSTSEQPGGGSTRDTGKRNAASRVPGKPQPYQLLATYGGARIVEPFIAKGGEAGQRWHDIIAMHERMKKYVDGDLSDAPTDEDLIRYGTLLFDTLFPREIRRLYDVARSRERDGHLNVIFTSMIPWIADKPWEFAFDPDRKTFLATQELHFVRNALTAVPVEIIPPKPGPLRILVAVAQPIGTAKLSSEQEEAVIRRSFQPLIEAGLVELEVLRATTPTALHRWLSATSYDVVHFIGHGAFDEDAGQGYLVFEDEKGAMLNVGTRNACEILCRRGIRLVFLNACETGRGEARGTPRQKADFNRGIAPALVANGVPAVVANQFSVRDDAATEFSQHFYWSLAQGATFGSAAREARIAVNYSTSHDTIDWAVPVVYARDPEGESACSASLRVMRCARRLSPPAPGVPQICTNSALPCGMSIIYSPISRARFGG